MIVPWGVAHHVDASVGRPSRLPRSCFCASGTEQCGAIEVAANQGVVVFEHLTIGKPGKYQLLVELVKADANTGSSIVVSTTSSVFEVRYPSSGAECRAQPQWRKDDLDQSPTHGAGKAWFFQDTSVKCTSCDCLRRTLLRR